MLKTYLSLNGSIFKVIFHLNKIFHDYALQLWVHTFHITQQCSSTFKLHFFSHIWISVQNSDKTSESVILHQHYRNCSSETTEDITEKLHKLRTRRDAVTFQDKIHPLVCAKKLGTEISLRPVTKLGCQITSKRTHGSNQQYKQGSHCRITSYNTRWQIRASTERAAD